MNKKDVITTDSVNRALRKKSQGALEIVDIHLTAQSVLHLTLEDKEHNRIGLDLDPISQPVITPAIIKGKEEAGN